MPAGETVVAVRVGTVRLSLVLLNHVASFTIDLNLVHRSPQIEDDERKNHHTSSDERVENEPSFCHDCHRSSMELSRGSCWLTQDRVSLFDFIVLFNFPSAIPPIVRYGL